jgi:hypothetical protein
MTNVLAIDSAGIFTEVASTSAVKVMTIASDGSLLEVVASGSIKALVLNGDGGYDETTITFGGGATARQFMLPSYGMLNTNATRQYLLGGYGQINEVG